MIINRIEELPRQSVDGDIVAIDIEMYGQDKSRLHRPHGQFACISVKYDKEDVVYQIYDEKLIPDVFERINLASWTLVNALYDLRQLRVWDINHVLDTERPIWDCMLVEQNLFGGYYREASMADMARRYFDTYVDKSEREKFGTATYMTEEMRDYAALDVIITLNIRHAQESLGRDLSSYWNIDAPMIWVLLNIQPVKVDVDGWKKMIEEFGQKAEELQKSLGINVKSNPQVMKALEAEGIHVDNTQKKTLEKYAQKCELVRNILDTRHYRDACSKYGVNWLENSVEDDDLVWANFNINGASTGRMSSSRPNLQNIPRKEFPEYRDLFVSGKGVLLAPDVSQQEPRILGYLSQDKNLLEAVMSGESIHVYVARMIFDDPTIVKDGKDYRYGIGKAINLAIGYGLTSTGLSEQTGLSEAEAQKIIDKYFQRFPGVRYYMSKYRNMAYRDGYVTTTAGRRVYVNPYDFKSENNAINSPIQGGAADFTKKWAYVVYKLSKERSIPFSLCMMVHDELVFDVEEQYKEQTIEIINEAMQEAAKIYPGIPFTCDLNQGTTWACHE